MPPPSKPSGWFLPAILAEPDEGRGVETASAATLALGAILLAGFAGRMFLPEYTEGLALDARRSQLHQLLTFGFLHGGAVHFVWSTLFVLLFAAALERAAGPVVVVGVYLLAVLAGGGAALALSAAGGVAEIHAGASAGAAGLIGAVWRLRPGSRLHHFFPQPVGLGWLAGAFVALNLATALLPFPPGFGASALAIHGAGFAAGLGFALLARGALGDRTARSPASEAVGLLRERLEAELKKEEGESPGPPPPPSPMATLGIGSRSRDVAALLAAIESKDAAKAFSKFRAMAGADASACLDWENQWSLAQLLIQKNHYEGAVDALKRLLRRHPHAPCSIEARYELGLLYAPRRAMRAQAIEYLEDALKPAPPAGEASALQTPEPLDSHGRLYAYRLLAQLGIDRYSQALQPPGAPPPVDVTFAAVAEGITAPEVGASLDGEEWASSHVADDRVLGDVDSLEAAQPPDMTGEGAGMNYQYAESKPAEELAPLSIDDILNEAQPSATADPAERGAEAAGSDRSPLDVSIRGIFDSDPAGGVAFTGEAGPAIAAREAETPAGDPAATGEASTAPSAGPSREQTNGAIPVRLAEDSSEPPPIEDAGGAAPADSESDRAPSLADAGPARASRTVSPAPGGDRELTYSAHHRYSVILAPDAPVETGRLVELIREQWSMSEQGAMHALKRRRGILEEGLGLHEGQRLAGRLAHGGQEVLLVEHDARLDFGERIDVLGIKMNELGARFAAAERAVRRDWTELIALSCGSVLIEPGRPRHDALDLFYAAPGTHLRIWGSAFRPGFVPAGERRGGDSDMRDLAGVLATRASRAMRTRAFSRWLEGMRPSPTTPFNNPIEYDNYNAWHLMAHWGRVRLFAAARE